MFLIGLFLRNASSGSYEQQLVQESLGGMTAGDIVKRDFDPIDPQTTVSELVERHVLGGRGRAYPIMAGQELLGLVTLSDIKRIDRQQWGSTTVYRIMTPFERLHTVTREETALHVLQLMAERDVNQVPVVSGRLLEGIVNRAEVLRLIQTRRELAPTTQ
jgi:CBS domain-containing protein